MKVSFKSGFTLIELLVVVAIISLLSSIVFASLNSARTKAKDGAIKTEVLQLRSLMELNYNDYGSYTNLQPNVWNTSSACGAGLAGTYASQATAICNNIISIFPGTGTSFFLGNNIDLANKYSIMAYLPYKGAYYCLGSSGANSDNGTGNNGFISAGCWNNP